MNTPPLRSLAMDTWFYIQSLHFHRNHIAKLDRTPDPSSRAKRGDPSSSFDSLVKGNDFARRDGLPRFARSDEGKEAP
jgi:hypothetical protein